MTKTLSKLSLILAMFAGANLACADILIEPYLGYHFGKSKQTGQEDGTDKGMSFGARLGYSMLGFAVGADYMTGKWTESQTGQSDTDITPSNLGVFVGYTFPVLVRVYGAYNFQAKGKAESGGNSYNTEGKGIKLGVGFTGLPFVAINVEYMSTTIDKVDGQTLSNSIKQDLYGLVVSLPLEF